MDESFHLCHGTANNKIIIFRNIFNTVVGCFHILKLKSVHHFFHHLYFFPDAINKMKLYFWKKNSKRNPREPPTSTNIKNFGARKKRLDFRNSQRMEHMTKVK